MKLLLLVLMVLVSCEKEELVCAERAKDLALVYSSRSSVEERTSRLLESIEGVKESCSFLISKATGSHSLSFPNPVACFKGAVNLTLHFTLLVTHIVLWSEDNIVTDFYLIIQDLSGLIVDCMT